MFCVVLKHYLWYCLNIPSITERAFLHAREDLSDQLRWLPFAALWVMLVLAYHDNGIISMSGCHPLYHKDRKAHTSWDRSVGCRYWALSNVGQDHMYAFENHTLLEALHLHIQKCWHLHQLLLNYDVFDMCCCPCGKPC